MRRIGPYEIKAQLGRGGMGTVFAGLAPNGQSVAVKIMDEGFDEELRTRFRREVDALRRLNHPGIVAVLDAGHDRGRDYLVMELVEGESLQHLLRRGPLPPEQAVGFALELADALTHMHSHGILHRDLKPENVLRGEDGLRVADFGLALIAEAETDRLTRTGTTLGTPGFMPPEQANGDLAKTGPASDVYALGATLYALLTGRPPFATKDLMAQLLAVLEKAPEPPSAHAPDVDPRLDRIVLRCLEKAPEARFPSAEALRAALRQWETSPQGPPRGLKGAIAAGVLAAVAVLAGLALATQDRTPPQPDPTPPPPVATTPVADPVAEPPPEPAPPPPAWFAASDPKPELPLPTGLSFGEEPATYVNDRDGSLLVYVGEGVFLGKWEVSWDEYIAFCTATGRPVPKLRGQSPGVEPGLHPVTRLTWLDAWAYCRWAGLRLPAASDWRRGRPENAPSPPVHEWTLPRGRPSNDGPGAQHMIGNVAEFVDEVGPEKPTFHRVALGGSHLGMRQGRLTTLYTEYQDVGFRVCRRAGDPLLPPPPRLRWRVRGFSTGFNQTEPPPRALFDQPRDDAPQTKFSGLNLRLRDDPLKTVLPRSGLDLRNGYGLIAECSVELEPGRYQVWLTSDDGARLFVDGQLSGESWIWSGAHLTACDPFTVERRRTVELRVDHFELHGDAHLRADLFRVPDTD